MLSLIPPKLSLANLPTPYRRLTHIGSSQIWIKNDDQSGSVLSGNKVRKLEFLLAQAKAQGATRVITCGGLQSNHCRATALACSQLGLKCSLLLRDNVGNSATHGKPLPPVGNILLDQLAGADIHVVPAREYLANLEQKFSELAAQYESLGESVYCIPTGGSNGHGVWGYVQCCEELARDFDQCGHVPSLIVCAAGSGGTLAGLALGCALLNIPARVLGFAVCDNRQYFLNKVISDIRECMEACGMKIAEQEAILNRLNYDVNDAYIGPGYARSYPEMMQCIRSSARNYGEVFDPVYTGKAFHGCMREIEQGNIDDQHIAFIHTGGVFGLQAFAEEFGSFN